MKLEGINLIIYQHRNKTLKEEEKMIKKLAAFLAGAALLMAASGAMAIPTNGINDNRPFSDFGSSGETSLQSILDGTFGLNTLNAVTSQSNVGAWTLADSGGSVS